LADYECEYGEIVSIHAPVKGATSAGPKPLGGTDEFQSTPP